MSKYMQGTSIKFTSVISVATVSSFKITIKDKSGRVVVDSADLTKSVDKVYYYVFASNASHSEGKYTATLTATYNGYPSVSVIEFELEEQP